MRMTLWILLALPVTAAAQGSTASAALSPEEVQKALYAMGVFIGQRTPVAQVAQTPEELELVLKGFTAAARGEPATMDVEKGLAKMELLLEERQGSRQEREKKAGEAALQAAKAQPGATVLPSGVVIVEKKAGTGASPDPRSKVAVNYRGFLTDGTEFDSSYRKGRPSEFTLGNTVPCFREGMARMKVGGEATLVCPPATAYGEAGRKPSIPPSATLTFEVQLVAVDAAEGDDE